jgi:hypothetical protein
VRKPSRHFGLQNHDRRSRYECGGRRHNPGGRRHYKEDITITKYLSLIGAGSSTTIIDATGLPNGIAVNGSAVGS